MIESTRVRRSLSHTRQSFFYALEAEGRWAEFIVQTDKWRSLPIRWQVARMRALAFSGKDEEFNELIDTLSPHVNEMCSESLAVYRLSESAFQRRHGRWDQAQKTSSVALILAKQNGFTQLEADCLFGEAIIHANKGRKFLAIDLMQRIKVDSRQISKYRREMASLNEAWLLWDTGQWEAVKEKINFAPNGYKKKLEVYLAAKEGHVSKLRKWIIHGFGADNIYDGDLEQIVLILGEWNCLAGSAFESVSQIKESWLFRQLTVLSKNKSNIKIITKVKLCLNLLVPNSDFPSVEFIGQKDGWCETLEEKFVHFLQLARISQEQARHYYQSDIDLYLRQNRINSPLVPRWAELTDVTFSRFRTDWSYLIAVSSGLVQAHTKKKAKNLILTLQSNVLYLAGSRHGLSFQKSEVSCLLLHGLRGRKGKSISKKELHFCLGGSSYKSELHDERIHKLLQRVRSKIKQHWDICPWVLPGNHSIRLEVDIRVS